MLLHQLWLQAPKFITSKNYGDNTLDLEIGTMGLKMID